jgi:tRNA A37 methylthiotransferase MiaB
MDRVKALPLTHVHAFSYSKRDNTASATMRPEIKGNIAKERHRELTAVIKAKNYAFRREHSKELEVLLESGKEGLYSGFDQYFNKVEVQSDDDLSSNWVLLNNVEVDSDGNKARL